MTRRSALLRRLRRRFQLSLVAIPAAYLAAAVVLGDLAPAIDRNGDPPVGLDVAAGSAHEILGATATGMIAFAGFVVASVLVVVQFAAGQYTPRLILWFRRDPVVKHAIGSFLAAFLFSLVALRELPPATSSASPGLTVGLALTLLVGATLFFLVLLQRVMDSLRPRTLYAHVAREGIRAARAIYPARLEHGAVELGDDRAWAAPAPREVRLEHHPGVLGSFAHDALLAAAIAGDATIELVPGLGEFIAPGQVLLRVHGDVAIDDATLRRAVEIADERSIDQDPAFAMRIIVDTAIRALSPAVNDPTTGVQALDVLEILIRELAGSRSRGVGRPRPGRRRPPGLALAELAGRARPGLRRDPLLRGILAADRPAAPRGARGRAREHAGTAASRPRRPSRPAGRRRGGRASARLARARHGAALRSAGAGSDALTDRAAPAQRW